MADPTVPATLTPEQLDEYIDKKLGGAINAAFTARTATLEKKILEKMGTLLGEQLKAQLPELLKDVIPQPKPDDNQNSGKKQKDVELDSLRKQFTEMQQQLTESREAAARAEEKNRSAALQTLVTERLAAMGQITGTGAKLALLALTAAGRVGYGEGDESDRPVFRGDDGVTVDLDTGMKQWLKSDEAKFFQAPSGARGSGSRPSFTPPNGSGPVSREQATGNAMGYLAKALQNEFRGVDVTDEG
jgi:uncharacterized protein (DUF2267 family)